MKTIRNTILIASLTIMVIGCSGSDDPIVDKVQAVIDGLGKTWSVSSVVFENEDVTAEWNDFSLTFDQSKGYAATALSDESVLVWPTSGSYSFPNSENANTILRSDNVQVNIENLTETSARLVFHIAGRNEGGRDEALVGEWVFDLEI